MDAFVSGVRGAGAIPRFEEQSFLGGRDNPEGGVDLEVGANFLAIESRARDTRLWGGRATYRIRRGESGLRLAFKKVVLVDNDQPLPTLGFVI